MRLQGAGIELRQQQQAVQCLGQRPHAGGKLLQLRTLRGQAGAPQLFQCQVHRLQWLPEVVVGSGQEAILGPDRAIALVHQLDHVRRHLPALRGAIVGV